jgi:two-component system, NarL family, response regulator LiaR
MMPLINISIVEDDRALLDSLSSFLKAGNVVEVNGAFTTAEALLLNLPVNQPQLTLMDINLPGLSGIQAVAEIKEKYPNVLMMMCTSYEDADTIFASLEAGASGYILKTEGPERILAAIQEMIAGGSPMTGSIARKVVERFNKFKPTTSGMQLLTERELAVLNCVAQGMMNKEVATQLKISTGTARKHVQNIYEKLHVNTRVEAVTLFFNRSN